MRYFQVSQTLKMVVPNEVIPIEHYLRQPQRLVQAITDPTRIQQLTLSHFRLQLHPLQFMMLNIVPIVDLKVWTQAEGVLNLRSLDYEIQGVEFLPQSFHLELAGTLSPYRRESTTELRGKADLKVQVEVPPALKLLPKPVLDSSAKTFLNGILLTIKHRLEQQLLQDYYNWVKTNETSLISPLVVQMESMTS